MEGLFGFIIFGIILAISAIQKIKEYREEQEFRRGSQDRPTLDELPEETRRMLYGDPNVRPARLDTDEEVTPTPVARPQPPRPVQRQAPPPPPPPQSRRSSSRPSVDHEVAERAEQKLRPEIQSRPKRRAHQRLGDAAPSGPSAQERKQQELKEAQYKLQQTRKRLQQQGKLQRKKRPAPARGGKDTSSRGLALRLVNHPTGIRAAMIANEILSKPVSMREESSGH